MNEDATHLGDPKVIEAIFNPQFYEDIFMNIKFYGVKKAEKYLLDGGLHPSFVKAAMRRLLRERGW